MKNLGLAIETKRLFSPYAMCDTLEALKRTKPIVYNLEGKEKTLFRMYPM